MNREQLIANFVERLMMGKTSRTFTAEVLRLRVEHAFDAMARDIKVEALSSLMTAQEAADRLGITKRALTARVQGLRQRGFAGGVGWNVGRELILCEEDVETLRAFARPGRPRKTEGDQ